MHPTSRASGASVTPNFRMGAGGAPSQAKKDDEPIKVFTPEQDITHGRTTIAEAVPGGTILQRKDGGSAS